MRFRLLLLAALMLLASCTRTPPHWQTVDAGSPLAFTMWRGKASRTIAPDDWRWFEVAIQEFKYELMLAGKVSGSAAIEEAVRNRIDGRAFAEVVREGLQAHLHRKTAERDEMTTSLETNERRIKHRIKPGDADTLRDFDAHQDNLRRKLAKVEAEVAAAEAALARFATPSAG
jgi:hypothetical protein